MSHLGHSILAESDKAFWHGYLGFYESLLPATLAGLVVEFGVFQGKSIRWLATKYPEASIVGVDILPVQPEWPTLDRVRYERVDQSSESQVADFFARVGSPSLIIEDGSHVPSHQSRCLRLGFGRLRPGGIYILEDIHSSHPADHLFRAEFGPRGRLGRWLGRWAGRKPVRAQTSLSLLLALEHLRRRGVDQLDPTLLRSLADGTHFGEDDIRSLHAQIASIHVYRRPTLPTSCWSCGKSDYDYHAYRCRCGADLLAEADSMSIVIFKK